MSHLSRDERLLALDGALEPAAAAHVAACAACQGEIDALRSVVARVRAVDVPEPSPLFWDHLAARVGDAIAKEPAPVRREPWRRWRLAWAAAAIAIVAGAAYLAPARRGPAPASVVAQSIPTPLDAPQADVAEPEQEAWAEGDAGWGLITAMVDEGDGAVFEPLAGQSELSISALTAEERAALIGELEAALGDGARKG